MGRICIAAAALAIVVFGIVSDARPADAAIVYQWCARGRISETGAPTCGFSSYNQCMASFGGGVGSCTENPAYTGPTQVQQAPKGKLR